MQEYLVAYGVDPNRIAIGEGVGISSEARHVMSLFCPNGSYLLISSNWYLWPGRLIWKRWAKKYGRELGILSVKDTGGTKTRILYFVYFCVVAVEKVLGLSNFVESLLTKSQEKRKTEGFQMNGCA